MGTDIVQAAATYAEEVMGREGFRYVSAVVANCKLLALELEDQDGPDLPLDKEALIIAAYFHDISTISSGFQDHHVKSAQMAGSFLRTHHFPPERIKKVEQAILTHTTVLSPEQRTTAPLENQVLYDADKLGRLSGLAVVTSLIELGARYTNRSMSGEALVAILRHVEERFIELYQSLNTEPARNLAHDKFNRSVAFLDGVIEHLSDATPV